jgi:exodeoxyribonuclease VII small subunit
MPKKKLSFEDAMKRIEEIVSDLERGELPLEKSLDRFEEAVKLARSCQQTLEAAQKRISKLVRTEEDSFTLEPLDEPSED